MKHKFIVVEGPIGVGKTTLATKLSNTFNSQLILEDFSQNKFLSKFYEDVDRWSLATQLSFLLDRSEEFTKDKYDKIKNSEIISDYFIDKDKLFAKTVLSRDEFDLYMKIYDNLKLKIPKPDLIIYLQAKTETLLERIKNRGIIFEQTITENYIKKINDSYMEFFYAYKDSPLLIINTSNVNINNRKDYSMLVDAINSNIKGKNFLNPSTIKAD
ncbi:MAG: deoxynucleoside kinase [Gammaproteobacteria bacterium]|nr:deoxynucleoside kinase [Gammaproteobacteria bacterium]